ncbi:MAG: hypothetical protein LBN30_00795 [Oscillospiraceae bacterium]|nr:hypothetical protein [Oscillospiraceae bacterium]
MYIILLFMLVVFLIMAIAPEFNLSSALSAETQGQSISDVRTRSHTDVTIAEPDGKWL